MNLLTFIQLKNIENRNKKIYELTQKMYTLVSSPKIEKIITLFGEQKLVIKQIMNQLYLSSTN